MSDHTNLPCELLTSSQIRGIQIGEISETLCSLIFRIFEYWTMDKVQKPINSE
jgi:tRNA A22 N-methylase